MKSIFDLERKALQTRGRMPPKMRLAAEADRKATQRRDALSELSNLVDSTILGLEEQMLKKLQERAQKRIDNKPMFERPPEV